MMALAVHAAQEGRRKAIAGFLIATMFLGLVFLGIKGLEYYKDFDEHLVPGLNFPYKGSDANSISAAVLPGHSLDFPKEGSGSPKPKEELFFVFYFFMTGLHAIHLSIGIGILAVIAFLAWRGRFSPEHHTGVELTGLYWHFVDIIWVFLFPLLYLIGRH
jgi:cytochrome c oxidase subunit 3